MTTTERGGPPRLLVVTPRYPPLTGGVETHVAEVCPRLRDAGFRVTVLTTDLGARRSTTSDEAGLVVVRVPAWPRERDWRFAPAIAAHVRRGQWDLVHVQSYHTFVAPIAMASALAAGCPYVVTFHGGGHSSRLRHSIRRPQRALLRPLLARARRLVALTDWERDLYVRELHLSHDRFTVIPNGSDLPAIKHRHERRPMESPLVVSLGRLERYKGHHRVLAAFPGVVAGLPGARLWIAGDGPEKEALRLQAVELGVAGSVDIRSVPGAERQRFADELSTASLVVLMSEFETQPLAALEALALGVPLLVAEAPGLVNLAADGLARSLPVSTGPDRLADAIVDALRNPGRPPTIRLPTWDDTAAMLAETYRTILGHVG
jgi:glycosyltransferase involved in cell wall biosynthesis